MGRRRKADPPEHPSEEAILRKIDGLQGQLNELRAALAALRAPPPAPVQLPAQPQKHEAAEPFAFADFTWLTGNPRTTESPLETKAFTGEIRADVDFVQDFNHLHDHSIGGSSEIFRANEVQVTQLGIGGDVHCANVRGRLMTQFGMYSFTTPRNDASPLRGQWDLDTAYR